VQLTLRDTDEGRLLARLDAMLYKKGAAAVLRRLPQLPAPPAPPTKTRLKPRTR